MSSCANKIKLDFHLAEGDRRLEVQGLPQKAPEWNAWMSGGAWADYFQPTT
jgi:hypothetical protein